MQNMFQVQRPTEQHIKVENSSLTLDLTFGTLLSATSTDSWQAKLIFGIHNKIYLNQTLNM